MALPSESVAPLLSVIRRRPYRQNAATVRRRAETRVYGSTATSDVVVPVAPPLSVTVSTTLYVPAVLNLWVVVTSTPVKPSPKSHDTRRLSYPSWRSTGSH